MDIDGKKKDEGGCPDCSFKLMEWFSGNMVCAQCGYDDDLVPRVLLSPYVLRLAIHGA